jgi:glycosyltransferase involved in cell wall biosynthesis
VTSPDVSLLVCTRDRAPSLAATLASITRALTHAESLAVEVVLVDNGSRDATQQLLADWAAAQAVVVHLLHEPRPGLARARNRALEQARGRIIAMTDDDCVLHADYLPALARAFAGGEPAIVGGRILLGDPVDLMVTVKLEDHSMEAPAGVFPGGFVMGANLAFTADVVRRVGLFDERFGAGAPFVAAEDTDFLFRAQRLGIPLRYEPGFVVDHHHGRRLADEETRLLAGYGYGDGALYAKHWRDPRMWRAMLRDVTDLWRDIADPITTHADIGAFHAFRLRHKARGFVAYWRRAGTKGVMDGLRPIGRRFGASPI